MVPPTNGGSLKPPPANTSARSRPIHAGRRETHAGRSAPEVRSSRGRAIFTVRARSCSSLPWNSSIALAASSGDSHLHEGKSPRFAREFVHHQVDGTSCSASAKKFLQIFLRRVVREIADE